MPKFSVIIPVYNVENYIEKSIESVLNQNINDIEIILVDDGSSDKSSEICDKYSKKDLRIKVIHKVNEGLSEARNTGIKNSNGEYLLFLDGDDFWQENSLVNINKNITGKEDVIFLTMCKYFENKKKNSIFFAGLDEKKCGNEIETLLNYIYKSGSFPGSACTKLIKREFLIKNNLFFEKGLLSEDIDWTIKMLLSIKEFKICNNEFYYYRQQREGSITNNINLKNVMDLLDTIKKWKEKCDDGDIDSSLKDSLLGILAYQYCIVLGHLYSIKDYEKNNIFLDVKDLKMLLNYCKNKKVKLVKITQKVFGIKITAKMLNTFISMKYN